MVANKEVTKLDKSNVKLTVTIGKNDLSAAYKDSVNKYAKTIQLPGFRKGKVPVSLLETKYGESLKAEALGDILEKSLTEVFDAIEEKPLPYSQPAMEEYPDFDITKDLTFTVTYDIFPEVKIEAVDGLNVEVPQVEISDGDLKKELEEVQERNSIIVDKNDTDPAAKKDISTLTYFELDEKGKEIAGSKRQDFVCTIGDGLNLYKFDDDLVGMKKGETKEITKTFPADFEDKDLAGKTKKISVTITALKVKNVPALDDDLAQDVNEKFKTLDDLKADIKKNMQVALDARISEIKNQAIMEELAAKNPVILPDSMINIELESRWRMLAQRFQTSEEQLEKMLTASGQTKDKMLDSWKPDTEKALKVRLIMEKLMKDRDIKVTPEDVEAEYGEIAKRANSTAEEVKKHYADPRAKEYLIDDMKEQKLFTQLLEKATVKKGKKTSFTEVFAQKE